MDPVSFPYNLFFLTLIPNTGNSFSVAKQIFHQSPVQCLYPRFKGVEEIVKACIWRSDVLAVWFYKGH